ncbi:NAD(P)H-hydrate epimerase, partial [Candidatus Bathyarchaeota archaeon]|nr:NAD(P)H-hydrate epimerase [Candidatus Bathyarchaeota archaeon]
MLERSEAKITITSREMGALDMNAEYFGVSRLQMMENAGRNIALEVVSRFEPDKQVAIFCGLGGNGGDGFVAARHLLAMGFKVTIVLAGKPGEISSKEALENWNALQLLNEKLPIHEVYDTAVIPEVKADIIIDALLGTGTKGKLRPPILQLVRRINKTKAFRIAVDVPTGIDADTGEILGEAVKADVTITFHRLKIGLGNAKEYAGEIIVKDIG